MSESFETAHPLRTQLQAVHQQLTAPGSPFELEDIDLDGRRYRLYKNAPLTLAALIEQGRGFGDKEFIVWQDVRWTYTEFFRHVDALVLTLRQTCGITRGDRVAIAMRNRPEWMAAYAATILCGAIAVPLNSWGQHEELVYGLSDSAPKLLFCDAPRLAHVVDDLPRLALSAIAVGDDTDTGIDIVTAAGETAAPARILSYRKLISQTALLSSPPALPPQDIRPDDLAMIMYTSGTSSHPKGVVSTHRAMTQGIINMEYFGALFVMTSPERFGAMMSAGFEMTTLMAVPLFHSSGLHAQFLSALRTGRRLVVMYKWDVGAVLDTIARERITQLATAPAMMMQLLGDSRFDETDTASLAWLGFGGAGIPDRLIELVDEKKPHAIAGIGYGLTETNGPSNAATGEAFAWKPRSNGPTSPLFDVRITDEAGHVLPQGKAGEIWLRGVTLMQGYWNKEAATREVFDGDWFRTGDIGYFDDDDFLYVVDRIKDIVNRGGEKIASAEVESVLLQHPAIAEAAAFGVPDDSYGEALAVAVTLKPGSLLDADALRNHVAGHLAPYKIPQHVRITSAPLPRNAVGKILKRTLQAEVVAGMPTLD